MRSAIISSVAFVGLGLLLVPRAGLQTDEVLFAIPFYRPSHTEFAIKALHHSVPLMVMSYIGTLKTLLYWPLLHIFRPSVFSVRVPVVLIGVVTLLVFFRFASLIAGRRAAAIATVLLASDPTFLLTDTFDWGPVALQHLLLVLGCYLVASARVSLGFFIFGLALWNKAVFIWSLCGLAAGVLVAYGPAVRRFLGDWRPPARAGAAMLAGALPLIVYNFQVPNRTLGLNAHLSLEGFGPKLIQLRNALDGSGLLGYLVAEDWEVPSQDVSGVSRVTRWLREHAGERRRTLGVYAVGLAVLLLPLLWREHLRRAAVFSLACGAVTFMAMAVTRDGGSSIHHTVLTWPMPQLFVAAALCGIEIPAVSIGFASVLVGANLLVIGQYIFQFERNGPTGDFTDAIWSLASSLQSHRKDTIFITDWGMVNNVDFLYWGSLDIRPEAAPLRSDTPPVAELQEIGTILEAPNGVFVGHVESREMFPGVGRRLSSFAAAHGYRRVPLATIADSKGHPVFELFKFECAPCRR